MRKLLTVDLRAAFQLLTVDPRAAVHISPLNHTQFLNLPPPNPSPTDGGTLRDRASHHVSSTPSRSVPSIPSPHRHQCHPGIRVSFIPSSKYQLHPAAQTISSTYPLLTHLEGTT
ncbi:hypothetical protein BV22DRAFT_1040952 [Leucogyrophana mollusca]|uniref:Uncharacterized protein n=1 Tax=Leucogyrophana mollusca TaxID=85980 RepID=A0ACB8B1I4_9AGAM|nr:hypothetical protein BV22DRAFT_1040952 [Leucogyrophana mollusca]